MRCPTCNKKVAVVQSIKCKYCDVTFCMSCRMPEVHSCNNIKQCKQDSQKKLETRLLKEKTIAPKVQAI